MYARVSTAEDFSTSDKTLLKFRSIVPEFCWRVCGLHAVLCHALLVRGLPLFICFFLVQSDTFHNVFLTAFMPRSMTRIIRTFYV